MLMWLDPSAAAGAAVEGGVLRAADVAIALEADAMREQLALQGQQVLAGARRRAEEMIDAAKAQAEEIVSAARAGVDAELAAAQRRGYEEGMRQAVVEWHAKQTPRTLQKAQSLAALHGRLAEIVTAAVERIVHSESREALYARALRSVQSLTRGTTTLTLRVSEGDREAAAASIAAMVGETLAGVHIEVLGDPQLQPGGCLFESEFGILDASLHTQLEGLRGAMDRALRRALAEAEDGEGDEVNEANEDDHGEAPALAGEPA